MSRGRARRRSGATVPAAMLFGMVPGALQMMKAFDRSGFQGALAAGTAVFTGFDPSGGGFKFGMLRFGLMPLIGGLLVHKFIGGGLGVNRMLASARVPLLRL